MSNGTRPATPPAAGGARDGFAGMAAGFLASLISPWAARNNVDPMVAGTLATGALFGLYSFARKFAANKGWF